MADSNDAPRKTLDDIRRELAAEYPMESQVEETPVRVAVEEDDPTVQRFRSVERRRARRRRYVVAASLGGVAILLLIVPGRVALTREPVPLNARGIVPASSAAPASVVREPREAQPVAPTVGPGALGELDREVKALRSELRALAERLGRSDSRLGDIESRVQGVESSTRRLAAEAAPAAPTRTQRSVPAPRQAKTPAPVVAVAPSPAPITAPDSGRWIPATPPLPESSPAPHEVRPAVDVVTTPEAPPPAPSATDSEGSRSARAVPEAPPTFRQKLNAEWRTIKQGFASAGDDFKSAMRDFTRKLTRE